MHEHADNRMDFLDLMLIMNSMETTDSFSVVHEQADNRMNGLDLIVIMKSMKSIDSCSVVHEQVANKTKWSRPHNHHEVHEVN